MKKLLVTGASGFLGWTICNVALSEWSVYGTVFSHPVEIKGVHTIRADLRDYHVLKKLFQEIQPDAVIHAAAETRPNYCEDNPSESHKINVDVTITMTELCADSSIPLVFTSTDLVFDGITAPYAEQDPANPICRYGEQKAAAEQEVLERFPDAVVCRLPLMFGKESPGYNSFFQTMVDSIIDDKELKLFYDEYRTPVSTYAATRGIMLALDNAHGILHLGGKERISRFDFGLMLSKVIGKPAARLIKISQKGVSMSAPRPADVSLDSSRAFAMGFHPKTLREELEILLTEMI